MNNGLFRVCPNGDPKTEFNVYCVRDVEEEGTFFLIYEKGDRDNLWRGEWIWVNSEDFYPAE